MAEASRKNGTFIHGVAASEHLDSSGERIKIEGVDISSLTRDGILNMEHQSKEASSIVGKIWEAKKIMKKADCENDHHRYFWDKVKMPFIYIAGELFDAVGHKEASEIAAMLRFDKQEPLNKDAKKLINFSIEGSRVEKQGAIILKCIARKVSITLTPCNKVCEAEELKVDNKAKKETDSGEFTFIQDMMSKSDEASCQIMKGEIPFIYKADLASPPGSGITPKRTFTPKTAPSTMRVGDRIDHTKQPKAKTGTQIYGPMNKGKAVNPKDPVLNPGKFPPKAPSEKKQKQFAAKVTALQGKKKLDKYESNMRKAITASCGVGSSPSAKVDGAAVAKSEFLLIRKLGPSDITKASKNVREQRKKVFGTSSQPGAKSSMREKHINHIKKFVDKFMGLDLQPSGGKINEKTGKRRDERPAEGEDKPDWRSGKFEAQWNPEAIVHEIAHLMLLPEGVGLEDGQRLMDKQYVDVQKQYGYMQQKRSQGEVQPMAAEQLIRRFLGLPSSKVSVPVKSAKEPQRTSVEDPTKVIATRVQQGSDKQGKPKFVDLIRQARNLTPEHKQRLHDIFSGKLAFHPDRGWGKNKGSLDAAITSRQPGAVVARQEKRQQMAPQQPAVISAQPPQQSPQAAMPSNVVPMKPRPAPSLMPAQSAQPSAQAPMQPKMKIAKSERRQIMKDLGDEAFQSFEKKEELVAFLKEKLPNVSEKEHMALAKAVAFVNLQKKESILKKLIKKDR